MRSFSDRWRIARRAADRFARARGGAAAVEFALVAAPFFFMLFAIIEVALVFFVGTILENATAEAARHIRTGELQLSGGGEAEFRQAVCNGMVGLFDCDRITVDVRTFTDFESIDPSNPLDEDGELEDNFTFAPGNAREIVLVRVFYEWDLVTPVLSASLSNMTGNKRLMTAAAAFRNEPYN